MEIYGHWTGFVHDVQDWATNVTSTSRNAYSQPLLPRHERRLNRVSGGAWTAMRRNLVKCSLKMSASWRLRKPSMRTFWLVCSSILGMHFWFPGFRRRHPCQRYRHHGYRNNRSSCPHDGLNRFQGESWTRIQSACLYQGRVFKTSYRWRALYYNSDFVFQVVCKGDRT